MVDFENPIAIKIRKQIVQALSEYELLESGDKLMVCVSGGKDSSILLALLTQIRDRSPYKFDFEAVILDQKQPGFQAQAFKDWVQSLGVKLTVLEQDTYSIVKEKVQGGTYCSLCSRLRRGILYNYAHENGFTKMALGHHRDDLMETLLLNLFYSGKISSMPAKLLSDDQRNVLIRPMIYVAESDLRELAAQWAFPIIPCNLCGSQTGLKRTKIKQMLTQLEREIPQVKASMMSALGNVRVSQLLDANLWDFKNFVEVRENNQYGDDSKNLTEW